MIPSIEKITQAIAGRIDLDSLYLCGPFDREGRPASADIHILALSRDGEVRDLHFLPEPAGFERRIEVSVVPAALVEICGREGVGNWLAFYTLDKMMRGKPIVESAETAGLKRSLAQGINPKPSFYAGTMGNLRSAWIEAKRATGLLERSLQSNLVVLLTLCLYSLLYLKRPFSKNSDLLTQTGKTWRRGDVDGNRAETILAGGKRFIEAVLRQNGFKADAVADRHLCFPPGEGLG